MEKLEQEDGLPIPDKAVAEIRLLSAIAKANGSLLSLQDLADLTDINLSEEHFEAGVRSDSNLTRLYEVSDGFVFERKLGNNLGNWALLRREREKQARATNYANFAREFASRFKSKEVRLIAISGSTSYQRASETDDLDFFCITQPGSLWIFLTKTLLLSRFSRLFRKNAPRVCFSYVSDQSFAERDFSASRDALFARDALTTMVIHGRDFYVQLLKSSAWISQYFPRLYQQRTRTGYNKGEDEMEGREERSRASSAQKFLNLLLRYSVGSYISAKASMLNRKFRSQGRLSSLFSVRIGSDHCIFESVRYSNLRSMYKPFATEVSARRS